MGRESDLTTSCDCLCILPQGVVSMDGMKVIARRAQRICRWRAGVACSLHEGLGGRLHGIAAIVSAKYDHRAPHGRRTLCNRACFTRRAVERPSP